MRVAVWLLALALLWPAAGRAQSVRLTGSTTVKFLVDKAAPAYMRMHPGVSLIVRGGDSTAGARALIAGETDIAMMSREPGKRERAAFRAIHARGVRLGLDAVAPAVSAGVWRAGVHAIDRPTLRAIWQGRIRNWKALGGPDRPILLVDRETGSGTRALFMRWMGLKDARHPPEAVLMPGNAHTRHLLAASDQALGFLPFGWLNDGVHGLHLRLPDGGTIAPDPGSVRDGRWPMRRVLWLWLREDAPAYVAAVADWLASEEAGAWLKKAGYLPLTGGR